MFDATPTPDWFENEERQADVGRLNDEVQLTRRFSEHAGHVIATVVVEHQGQELARVRRSTGYTRGEWMDLTTQQRCSVTRCLLEDAVWECVDVWSEVDVF